MLVEEGTQHSPDDWTDPVHPLVFPFAKGYRGAKCACRVDGTAGEEADGEREPVRANSDASLDAYDHSQDLKYLGKVGTVTKKDVLAWKAHVRGDRKADRERCPVVRPSSGLFVAGGGPDHAEKEEGSKHLQTTS